MEKKGFSFLFDGVEYSLIVKIENNRLIIEVKEKNNDIPFNFNLNLNYEEIIKLNNVFLNLNSLNEIKIFLDNIFSNKDNIKNEIDESEENMIVLAEYDFFSLRKNIKLNLKKNILSKEKMIKYLTKQNILLKKEILDLKNKIKSNELEKNNYESKIITTEKQLNLIKSGINNSNNKNLKLKLVYRASTDGDTSDKFHSKCDGISPTIEIFKTTDDFIFGGYTDIKWDNNSCDKKGENTFLFSFNNMQIYQSINGTGIYCSTKHGPWYSYIIGVRGNNFLKKEEDNCFSMNEIQSHWNNFKKEYELTGGKKKFIVKEIEVFRSELI